MRKSLRGRTVITLAGALLALQWSLTAQTPVTAKRPLTYDVVDYWKSIQGTRLSRRRPVAGLRDSAQSEDGELVVRNLAAARNSSTPRGTAPTFTPDGKFVVFTIVQTKAEEESERRRTRRGAEPAAGSRRRAGQAAAAAAGAAARDAAHRHRHHDARRRTGEDVREGRQLQPAGKVLDLARVSQGDSAAAAAAADAADAGARRGPRRRRRRPGAAATQRRRRRPDAQTRQREKRKDAGRRSDRPQPRDAARKSPSPRSPSTSGTRTATGSPTPCRRPMRRRTARSRAT